MVEQQHYDEQPMDAEEEQAYLMQLQMQQQQQQEIYTDEYGQEVMMNQMGQHPQQYDTSDATNALVSLAFQSRSPERRYFCNSFRARSPIDPEPSLWLQQRH